MNTPSKTMNTPSKTMNTTAENWQFSPPLEEEIAYQLETCNEDREDGEPVYTRAEAIRDLMQDADIPHHSASQFRKELNDFGIATGIYKAATPAQLENSLVINGKKYDFKKNGTAYRFENWKPLGLDY